MVWTPFTRKLHCLKGLRYASDLSDKEWLLIKPHMLGQPKRGRRRTTDLQAVMNAVFYLLHTGCQWALLLKDFPPSSTVHYYFKRFADDGTLDRVHEALYVQTRQLEGREDSPTFAIIDSQSAKTGSDARGDVGYDAGKKVKGRKRHILVDVLGLMLSNKVHSAGSQDREGLSIVCDRLTSRFPFIEVICADGGYQGKIAAKTSPRPLQIIKRNQKAFQALPKRWIVERTFAWLGINRRFSKDIERYARTSEALISAAMIKLMLRRVARYHHS